MVQAKCKLVARQPSHWVSSVMQGVRTRDSRYERVRVQVLKSKPFCMHSTVQCTAGILKTQILLKNTFDHRLPNACLFWYRETCL